MTPEYQDELRRRQRSRAKVTAIALFALVALFFAIAVVRLQLPS